MPQINILSPHVADLIAAGEVVERPASVIKELVENSIDAGARNITVEIRGGGMRLIRVADDGCGMGPEDAGVAFLRHATSKLRDARGLESISTLGFRGEALAAISSVSHIELLTREKGAGTGTRVLLSAGDIEEMGPAGCPEGTVMTVRDLFFNTPARLKFMKSDKAEGSACVSAALRCALGHPEVSVRMLRDGEEQFFSPGDGSARSAIYSLLGRENAGNMVECALEGDGVQVRGYVTAPHAGRGSRAMQFFFINGRAFRSTSMQAALEQAYKNTLLTGRFPGCVLYLTLSCGKVDVNVHPAKTEVKFTEEKKVFDCVYGAVRAALEGERKTAEITLSPAVRASAQPRPDFYKTIRAEELRAPARRPAPQTGWGGTSGGVTLRQEIPDYGASTLVPRVCPAPAAQAGSAGTEAGARMQMPNVNAPGKAADLNLSVKIPEAPAQPRLEYAGVQNGSSAPCQPERETETEPECECAQGGSPVPRLPETEPGLRVIGEAMNTYIIAETQDGLLLIDKHAAHERMIFDRLAAQDGEVMSQSLLLPVTWTPGAGTAELLEQNRALLERAGFEIDAYGEDSVIIRAVPADTDGDETAMLEEICEKLRAGSGLDERRSAILHTIACKAAVKAGMVTDRTEMEVIAQKVASGEVRYCPHGRPVSVKLTKKELDKQFRRIV